MQLKDACVSIIEQLEGVVDQMSDSDFQQPSMALSGITVGQHLRHTIEFFLCLEMGYGEGLINYDKRSHDKVIETDRTLSLAALDRIKDFIAKHTGDQPLQLEVGYERHSETTVTINTTYFRELIYNIEHAVHHMALMKIGIREVAPFVKLPADFGIAVSTLRHSDATTRLT
jgi:hypothetical protein